MSCGIHMRVIQWEMINMMTSPNGNIFRVTGPLCGEFPAQRPVTRSFDVFFDLRPNKRVSKQPWGWWFETLSWSLWRHCNEISIIGVCFKITNSRLQPHLTGAYELTHWGRVTHICVSKLTIIGSDIGLSPGRCHAIFWTNAEISLIWPLGINFSEILI